MYMNLIILCVVFFKQKTAYEMRISDWSSDVCSSDLCGGHIEARLENSDIVGFLDNHQISKDALDLFRFLVEKSDWAFVGEADRRAESVAYRGPDETEQILRGRGDLRPDAAEQPLDAILRHAPSPDTEIG